MKVIDRRISVIAHDLLMVAFAWLVGYSIRQGSIGSEAYWAFFLSSVPIVLIVQGLVLWSTGLYRGMWRFASIPDLWNITRAVVLGTLLLSVCFFFINRLEGIPRSTFIFYPVFLVLLLGGPRLLYRMWKDHGLSSRNALGRKRVLILGAGRAGEMLVRDMCRDVEYMPIGFLDDNPRLKKARLHGLPVLGMIAQLEEVVSSNSVDIVVIAMPSANSAEMRRIVELCEASSVPFRTLPRLQDLVSEGSMLQGLREVAIDDLLGREPVTLNWKEIERGICSKVVLVSGGGGSIGSELCRQVARLSPKELVILDSSEFNLYSIEMEIRRTFPELVLHVALVDVVDSVAVEYVFKTHNPAVIFHAAAYKHVPMLETQARQAVRNNVLGTQVLANVADKYQCGTFVLVSTDKAVNPANVMGASKRAAEIFCQTLDKQSKTKFITVRFGNVLGSAGSVVPLFRQQIAAGGPVTVTHKDITRYFMTIPEACQLIMQAGAMGQGGEIFVLDMGEPVKVSYLAEQMIRLSGKQVGQDIKITYTGLRPGEKLYEELFHEQENLSETGHEKIFLAESRSADWDNVTHTLSDMQSACAVFDECACVDLLKHLVPEMNDGGASSDNVVPLRNYNEVS